MWSSDLWITSDNPKAIPFYGYISKYRARQFTTPGAPWQKWTSLTFYFPLDVVKLPLIKFFSKNKIEGWINLKNLLISAWVNLFILIDIKIIFRFPPSPCAPPKYYFPWNS